MTTLFENLPALETAAGEIGGRLGALLGEHSAAVRAADELLQAIEGRRGEAEALAEQVYQALEQLAAMAGEYGDRLEVGAADVEQAADATASATSAAQDALGTAVDQAAQDMDTLQGELAQGGSAVEAAEGESDAGFDALAEGLRAGQEELSAAVESAAAEAEALSAAAEQARERVAQAAEALRERMNAVLDQARSRIDAVAAAIEALAGAHAGVVGGEGARLASGAFGLGDDVESRLEADVRSPVAAQAQALVAAFEELAQKITGAHDVAMVEREAIDGLLARLEDVMAPLPGAIASVQQAAAQVGLPWG